MAENYQLKLGDCIFCIIHEKYLLPETVWEHSNNESLRGKRSDLRKLQPGDTISIPDIRPKEVNAPTNQVHKFHMKGKPHLHWIEIELVGEDGKPIPNEKYKITLPDGSEKEGTLNQNGWARAEGPANGDCEVTFPELDKMSWEFVGTGGPKGETKRIVPEESKSL